ncbi:hypothetical protein CLQ46_25205 [Klebsiella pneumoniae subsp. pneumoniae]|nr:hypothetical protein CLQ46_01730 [Klebsiella pneumoniae subsp. pneumoniae]AVZ91664.1 hypothetical protein CLQ46_25205 [Klebsiella pneumoniae subsp. pneumoniae]
MGSCAAPSAKGDDKFITTDYLQQCPGEPSPVKSPGGGLVVAPSCRHPKGEMHSAKTFCEGPQKL